MTWGGFVRFDLVAAAKDAAEATGKTELSEIEEALAASTHPTSALFAEKEFTQGYVFGLYLAYKNTATTDSTYKDKVMICISQQDGSSTYSANENRTYYILTSQLLPQNKIFRINGN